MAASEVSGPTAAGGSDGRLRRALWWSAGLTLLLWVVPFGSVVGYPLYLLSTLVHELGHGLTAELVGGDFVRLEVTASGAGVAYSVVEGRFARALVAAGGLLGPAVAALLGFVGCRHPRGARLVLLGVALLTAVASVLWVRSAVGVLVAVLVTLVCGAAALAPPRWPGLPQLVLVFLSVQLALSVFSRSEYLFTRLSVVTGGAALSDSEAIAALLPGPWWFWGGVCGVVSLAVVALGARVLLGGLRRPATG